MHRNDHTNSTAKVSTPEPDVTAAGQDPQCPVPSRRDDGDPVPVRLQGEALPDDTPVTFGGQVGDEYRDMRSSAGHRYLVPDRSNTTIAVRARMRRSSQSDLVST